MNRILLIITCCTCTLLISCLPESGRSKQDAALSEVDKYFREEVSLLERSDAVLTKTLYTNGSGEQAVSKNPDWEEELVPFIVTISNQPAPLHSFATDTLLSERSMVVLYTARDSSATIKKLSVYSHSGITDSVVMIKKVSNSYYASTDTLSYYGKGNYRVAAENIPGFGKKIGFVLVGETLIISEKK